MSASNYAENFLLDTMFRTGTTTRPSSWTVSLHTADPGEAGTTAEVSGGGYSRASVTFNVAASGSTANSGTVTFPTSSASWGTITHVGIWDNAGNHLWSGPHNPATQAIPSGSTYTIAAGQLTISFD